MPSTHPAYKGPWPRIRKAILERDQYTCQIAGPKCTTTATHVDHIIPVTQGGAWYDPTNLRASCPKCNYARIDRTQHDRWQTSPTRITLVIGPPHIPKQPHIKPNPTDLIIDYDNIAEALTIDGTPNPALHKAALKARGAILGELQRGRIKVPAAWIISSNPNAESMFPHHTIQLIDPGFDEALRHIQAGLRAGTIRDREAERLLVNWYRVRKGGKAEAPTSRQW